MAKYCPEINGPVLYLFCQECEESSFCKPDEYIGQDKIENKEKGDISFEKNDY